ncbi:alpha/beta fold hydrolase [Streptomyces sp900105755]|uniref:alpha/beta fold hydrolase n=1 Tax=Streptomyces sp. 900105755 TaxID=3154389 RepID=UPI00331A128F
MQTIRRGTRIRRLLPLVVAVPAAALISVGPATAGGADSSPSSGGTKPTVVLVHGAWADASSWDHVVKNLQARGYPVIATANLLRSLSGDSAHLAAQLKAIKGPIVLVGHSYGGAVITNAAAGNPTPASRGSPPTPVRRPRNSWRSTRAASSPTAPRPPSPPRSTPSR